jgi:hypothetical protein
MHLDCLDAQADLLRTHIRKHTFDAIGPVPVSRVRWVTAAGLADVTLILIESLHDSDCFAGAHALVERRRLALGAMVTRLLMLVDAPHPSDADD